MRINKDEEKEAEGHECIGLCCDDLVDINERDDL
ncbi:hypothetical protein Stok01_00066 [Sulfurisphaera tokodaii]